MTTDLEQLMTNLSDPERDRLMAAFAADPGLAEDLGAMIGGLPYEIQEQLIRRLGVHLETTPLGGGALLPALTDVIEQALERFDSEER